MVTNEPTSGPDLSGDIELPNGDTVTIPRPDKVFPTFSEFTASADVYIEDGRIRIREENDCTVRLGVVNNNLESPDGPVATIHAGISDNNDSDDEDIYSEIALDSTDEIRELRDALTLALRYRGSTDD